MTDKASIQARAAELALELKQSHLEPNRSRLAREHAGLSLAQAAKLLGVSVADLESLEALPELRSLGVDEMAELYHVNVDWLTGEVPQCDFAAVDAIPGADQISAHDRAIIAEFAASMPRTISGQAQALRNRLTKSKEKP